MTVAVLFACNDSNYKNIPGCDVYDINRDARTFKGASRVICHPPCRAWGRFSNLAKPRPGEKELALWAVTKVQENGGVLEHPSGSKLWKVANLPLPGFSDQYGFTIQVQQSWWGHLARKSTWLYICGIKLSEVEPAPLFTPHPEYVVCPSKGQLNVKHLPKSLREHTPPDFADYLVRLVTK